MVAGVGIDSAAALLRAANLLDQASILAQKSVGAGLKRLVIRNAGEAEMKRAFSHAQQAVDELERGGGRASQAAAGVRAMIVDLKDTHRPMPFREAIREWPLSYAPKRFALVRDRLERLAAVDGLDDATVRARFGRELDEHTVRLVAKPKDGNRAAIAALVGMPESVRPAFLRSRFDTDMYEMVGASPRNDGSMVSGDMVHELRAAMDRRAMAAEPGMSRASLRAELDLLLARDAESLSHAELRRISLMSGMPDELRPGILDAPAPFPKDALVDVAGDPFATVSTRLVTGHVRAVQVAVEVEAMHAAGTLPTRDAALAELATILDTPNEAITAAQLRRMSLLTRLPEDIRPPLPPRSSHKAIEHAGITGRFDHDTNDLNSMLDDARLYYHVLRSPDEGARALRASFEAGEGFNLTRLTALQRHGDILERAGITPDMVAEHLTRQLARAGEGDVRGSRLAWAIQTTRDRIATQQLDANLEPLRIQALEFADRNLARMAGTLKDGWGRHPDYAEVGRLAAIANLFDSVAKAPRSNSAGGGVAAAATEKLTW